MGLINLLLKKIYYFLYTVLFRHTAEDTRPYSFFFPWIRNILIKHSILKCGNNIRVKSNANISPNIIIGNNSELGTRCNIQANTEIGNNVIMGPDVKIYTRNHNYENPSIPIQFQGKNMKNVVIGNNVWIGANVVILPGVRIGNNTIIAAGAIVSKSFEDNCIIGGNPAKKIKNLYENQ